MSMMYSNRLRDNFPDIVSNCNQSIIIKKNPSIQLFQIFSYPNRMSEFFFHNYSVTTFLYFCAGNMILFTKKKITMETPPFNTVVPIL